MRVQQQQVVILSASRDNLTVDENHTRSRRLLGMLDDCGYSFKPAVGHYKGTKEISFVVLPKNETDIEALKGFAFDSFDQDKVLYTDSAGQAYLEYSDGRSETRGKLKQVHSIKGLESYTELSGKFYSTGGF